MKSKYIQQQLVLSTLMLALTACNDSATPGDGSGADNTAPVIRGIPANGVRIGTHYEFQPEASDADNDKLMFKIINKPDWAEFDMNSGTLSGDPEETDIGVYGGISISVTDGKDETDLAAFEINVLEIGIKRSNIQVDGISEEVLPTTEGAESAMAVQGTTEITVGEQTQTLGDADVTMEFDAEGNLIQLAGKTLLPPKMAENFAINSDVKARVGMYKGSEINADPDFGIQLKEDIYYFVYYMGTSTEIVIGSEGSTQLTLEPPVSGEILFISDPTDPFYYYFASIPLVGETGHGKSLYGQIPFTPTEDFSELDAFDGQIIDKGSFALGMPFIDLFNIEGSRVTRLLTPGDINWDDPMASDLSFKTGFNGAAKFSFAVLDVGLFEFDLASSSSTLDVAKARQHYAMQATLAPDVSWQPDWFTILPQSELVTNLVIDGESGFEYTMTGQYQSTIPPATMDGSFVLNQKKVSFNGQIDDPIVPLTVNALFEKNQVHAEINTAVNIAASVDQLVNQTLDDEITKVGQAYDNLTTAIADYELELSLHGLRGEIVSIVDNTVAKLDAIPNTVYNSVYTAVKSAIDNLCYSKTVTVLGVSKTYSFCAGNYVNATSTATSWANSARTRADNAVSPVRTKLLRLKEVAQFADDETNREALRLALLDVYNNTSVTIGINKSITIPLPWPFSNKTYSYNYSKTFYLVDSTLANRIKDAADNIYRIAETSTIVLSAQGLIDQLPTLEEINQVKDDVLNKITVIPSFQGAGFDVIGTNYSAYIILDGDRYNTAGNLLDAVNLPYIVATTIKDILLSGGFK